MNEFLLKPGSHISMKAGCTCPMLENHLGLGVSGHSIVPLFQVDRECPLHAHWNGASAGSQPAGRRVELPKRSEYVGTIKAALTITRRVRREDKDSDV